MPVDLDFSYLLNDADGSLLKVYDNDYPFVPNGVVNFEIDADNADRFSVLPSLKFPEKDFKNSTTYAPRIALKQHLSASDGPITFRLIAKDGGTPQQENSIPITINIKADPDLHDPLFDYAYYSASIQNQEFTGILNVLPKKIRATNEEVIVGENITYVIKDADGLPLRIVNESDEGIDIQVDQGIDPASKNRTTAHVVIEASQTEQMWRRSSIILIIELPFLPPLEPTVAFVSPQYFSEIVENSDIGAKVIVVKAISSNGESVAYSLDGSKLFSIDSENGLITVAQSLTKGTHQFNVTAGISSATDTGLVTIYVVKQSISDDVAFEFPLYSFQVLEGKTDVNVGQVHLPNGPSYSISLNGTIPVDMQGYFEVKPNGIIIVRRKLTLLDASLIRLNISATNPLVNDRTVNTLVEIEVVDVNDPPKFIDYPTPLIIGYPRRTYTDSLIPMPIFTVQAVDPDPGDNGVLIYSLLGDSQHSNSFDIDSTTGSLYFKRNPDLTSEYNILVSVTDKSTEGLKPDQPLHIKVNGLDDDQILIMDMTAKDGGEELDVEIVNADLKRILVYDQVVTLHKLKSLEQAPTLGNIQTDSVSFVYTVSLYAVKEMKFISKDVILQNIKDKSSEFLNLTWIPHTELIPTNNGPDFTYLPTKIINSLKSDIDSRDSDVNSLTVGVSVVSVLFGITLIGIIFVTTRNVILRRKAVDRPDSRRNSTGFDQTPVPSKSNYSKPSDWNSTPFSADFNAQVVEKPKTKLPYVAHVEEEAYCPPTPSPQRSILKDGYDKKKDRKDPVAPPRIIEEKKEKDGGVKFNPTPEVIQVASTVGNTLVQTYENNNDIVMESL